MYVNRRSFFRTTLGAAGVTLAGGLVGRTPLWGAAAKKASDIVFLGPDKVRLSRLAIGLGTIGGSIQRNLGIPGVADLLQFGYDQGLFFWDTADSYRTHPHVKEGLKRIAREKVTIQTKTRARTADEMKTALDRYRLEIGTDYLDIVLLHTLTSATWPKELQGPMEVLAEAREKGIVRTHGLSCHALPAMQTAAQTPWVRVALLRINPAGMKMDADPASVVPVMRAVKAAGKGIIGMKIIGEGGLRNRVDECLGYALSLDCVDCFTIGPANRTELADLIARIPIASQSSKAA